MQRAPGPFGLAFGVQGLGDGERLRVGLDDVVKLRPLAIQGLDALEIGPGQGPVSDPLCIFCWRVATVASSSSESSAGAVVFG